MIRDVTFEYLIHDELLFRSWKSHGKSLLKKSGHTGMKLPILLFAEQLEN